MKRQTNSSSSSSSKPRSQVQLNSSYRQPPQQNLQNIIMTPKKQSKQRIFVQTPQAIYIHYNQKNDNIIEQFNLEKQNLAQDNNNKPQKVSIFNQKAFQNPRKTSALTNLGLSNQPSTFNQILKSKTTISFKKQRISHFFFYQNFIVCKGLRKVIVYNFFNKSITNIPVKYDQFNLASFPPYVFNCITGQYLNLYSEAAVQKYAQIQRKKVQQIRRKNIMRQTANSNMQNKNTQQKQKNINNQISEAELNNAIQVIVIKISKLQVECICRYGQSLYMGGYNRSILPGGKKSQRRQIYLVQNLDPKINNKPKQVIKIQASSFPVSFISVQMPYLIVYCRPTFYVFSFKSHQLLLTFQKQIKNCFLLQGRYALNVINGIGISNKGSKSNIFTFDVESMPIYGVQITQHKQEASCLCLQKTGRIFGCQRSALFEYIPSKRITRCLKLYSQGETILWLESTSNNNLLVLRQTQNLQYVIQAFSIDQNSINQY